MQRSAQMIKNKNKKKILLLLLHPQWTLITPVIIGVETLAPPSAHEYKSLFVLVCGLGGRLTVCAAWTFSLRQCWMGLAFSSIKALTPEVKQRWINYGVRSIKSDLTVFRYKLT